MKWSIDDPCDEWGTTDVWHVWPADDERHCIHDIGCWCGPAYVREEDAVIIIHNHEDDSYQNCAVSYARN